MKSVLVCLAGHSWRVTSGSYTHTHTHTHACLLAAELNLITVHVHKSSEDTVTLTVLFTSSGLCLCPAFWENGCELPLSAWSGPCVCTPLFSHLSAQAFVVCRLVSLKLTHHGGLLTRLVSWGSVLEASCVVAFSWEAADKKKKKKARSRWEVDSVQRTVTYLPVSLWSLLLISPNFVHVIVSVCVCVCVFVLFFCGGWRSSRWFIFLRIFFRLCCFPWSLIQSNLLELLTLFSVCGEAATKYGQ